MVRDCLVSIAFWDRENLTNHHKGDCLSVAGKGYSEAGRINGGRLSFIMMEFSVVK